MISRISEKSAISKRTVKSWLKQRSKKNVSIAKSLGIVNLGHISTDGTKMKANASNCYTLSKEEIEEIEEDSGKKLKNAAKKIIEQHALGDENDKDAVMKKTR